MIYTNNMQEFFASVLVPFMLLSAGLLVVALIVIVLAAFMTDLFLN